MTRDDIIRLAREAGLDGYGTPLPALERFAALVAAAEREACAKVCAERTGLDAFVCAAAIRKRGEVKP